MVEMGAVTVRRPRAASAPGAGHVIRSIARRELVLGSRSKLVRFLFFASLIPPVVFIVVLLVRIFAEQAAGMSLPIDPLLEFLEFMTFPVVLLALSLGTPSVARDRAEDVLFLYATRPVLPWHYALGKMLSVAVPAFALMLLPGVLTALLRLGVTQEISAGEAFDMILKLAVVALGLGWGLAGVTVGASAATKKARWALLIVLAFFVLPDLVTDLLLRTKYELTPTGAVVGLLHALFGDESAGIGWVGLAVLGGYGAAGFLVTTERVRTEMIP